MTEEMTPDERVGWHIMAQRHTIEQAALALHSAVMQEQRRKGVPWSQRFAEADAQANEYRRRQYLLLRQEYAGDSAEIQSWIP